MNPAWARVLPHFIREKIEGRNSLQKALGNTGWMLGDQVVRKTVGLLIGVLVARHFGPQLYGEFSYAIAVIMIVSPIARLGLDAISIRDMAKTPSSRDEVLGTSFVLMTAAGGCAFLLAMIAIFMVRPESPLVHWLVGILAVGCIVQAFMAIEFWFESQMQWKFTVYAKTSAFLLLSFVKVGLLLLHAPLIAFAWAGLAETVLGSLGLLVVYRHRGFAIKAWCFSREMARKLLSDSWPLVLSALLTMVYLRIDQIMIGSMVGSAELGIYSVAVHLSEVWVFIPMVIISAVFPAFVEVERDNEPLFYAHLQKLYNMMAFYGYLVAIPVAFFAKEIVQFLFSAAYAGAGPLTAVLVWAMIFTSLGTVRNIFIVAKNWTRVNLVSIALGGLLNILLNLFLIPAYGAMGAVVATLISYWFAVHGTCFFFQAFATERLDDNQGNDLSEVLVKLLMEKNSPRFKVFSDPQAFSSLKAEWERLCDETDDVTVFSSCTWCQSWWESFGAGAKLHLFTMWQKGKLVGIAPLMAGKTSFHGLPVKIIGFIQDHNNHSLHNDFVVMPEYRKIFLHSLVRSLYEHTAQWDVIYFRNIATLSENYNPLSAVLGASGRSWQQRATPFDSPFLTPTENWDEYFAKMTRINRKNLKNLHNKMHKAGAVSVRNIRTWGEFQECSEELYEVAQNSWSGERGESIDADKNRDFIESLSRSAAEKGWLSIWSLSLDGKVIALEFHLRAFGREHALYGHYHQAFASLSPGTYLEMAILKQIHEEEEKVQVYDFCGAFDSYKKRWTKTCVPHCDILIFKDQVYSNYIKFQEFRLVPFLREKLRAAKLLR